MSLNLDQQTKKSIENKARFIINKATQQLITKLEQVIILYSVNSANFTLSTQDVSHSMRYTSSDSTIVLTELILINDFV